MPLLLLGCVGTCYDSSKSSERNCVPKQSVRVALEAIATLGSMGASARLEEIRFFAAGLVAGLAVLFHRRIPRGRRLALGLCDEFLQFLQ